MHKQEFLDKLRARLSDLPQRDVEERLNFYSEMMDDRMEEGCSEEEAVLGIGSLEEIASQVIADIPLVTTKEETIKPKRARKVWEILLLALGSPIWLALLIAAFAVVLSLYVSLWSVLISLWAVFGSFVACAPAGVLAGIVFAFGGNGLAGMAMIGTAFACAGVSVFLFFGCRAVTKGMLWLTKQMAWSIQNCFVKKGEV